tara:strand:+ start:1788 stop:3629 length:1842 start_codon:yes stop_codon:yes gene_type:complete
LKTYKNKTNLIILLIVSFASAEFSDTLSYYQKFDIALNSLIDKRFKLSQSQFSDIIKSKESYEPTSLIMLAKSLYEQKKYDEAEKIIKSELPNLNNSDYMIYAQILLSDIYLSKENFTSAFRNYLLARPEINDSINLSKVDDCLILCISNGLKENQLENILMKEKNIGNRSIINLARAYQSWLNGDLYSLINALDGVNKFYLTDQYIGIFNRLKKIKSEESNRPITLSAILPLSGNEKHRGLSYLMGLSKYLNISEINSSIRFVVYDSKGSSFKTLELVREIQLRPDVRGIVGPMLKEEILVISGFNSSMPILIPNSGPSDLADIAPNLFFLSPSKRIIAERTAQVMINFLGLKNIVVLSPADNESKIITDYFLNECRQLGIKPLAVEWYSGKPENISKQFKSIRKAAWSLIPGESNKHDLSMDIDSLDALFDVDVTDFLKFTEKDDIMDKKDSNKVVLETIEAFYMPIRKGELTYIGTQFPIYNLKTTIFGNENWLDMDVLKEEAIGPHVQGMKVISSLSSELLTTNYNLDINYYDLAIDHASFLESIISKKRNSNKELLMKLSDAFIGDKTSILFQGKNKNTNGAVQVLEFKKGLNWSGYYDGSNLVKINK